MFIGHYGPGCLAKTFRPSVPLWVLFLAVQAVDIAWAVLVILGVERVRIVPGVTAVSPLDLSFMPYTHSLPAALLWAAAAGIAYRRWRPGDTRAAALAVALAVLSHWLLDLVVHRPDLPLLGDAYKVGLGLWNHPVAALTTEAGLLLGGFALYAGTIGHARRTRGRVLVVAVVMLAAEAVAYAGPLPASGTRVAVEALAAYLAFAAAAYWIERS